MSRLNRQSFLGPKSETVLEAATIGIVGLGGGGSHVAQQAAHLGIGGYVIVDPKSIKRSNTNRLVGGTLADADAQAPKTSVSERLIRGLQPNARIVSILGSWHDGTDYLKSCDVIIGALDSFIEREQLERFVRRYLIPYIDIGMDVHDRGESGFLVSGQVILSFPGAPCLRCCGLITDARIAQESERYGAAGGRPQVIWSNGVLASTAIGLAVQVLTPWHRKTPEFVYLEYDGNKGTITHSRSTNIYTATNCPHHPLDELGDPMYDIREHLQQPKKDSTFKDGWNMWWRTKWARIRGLR